MKKLHADILVKGIVQGVGFRPFIHRATESLGITGWIRNTTSGAEIVAEGDEDSLHRLTDAIRTDHPLLAQIDSISCSYSDEIQGYTSFGIIESSARGESDTLISPDVGICDDCRRELLDPSDRRYRYPFINCTNCGPRFTIIRKVPYDRKNTTMSVFAMCPECSAEYGDINDRRYHAQPDCCSVCGPKLQLLDGAGRTVEGDPVSKAVELISRGKIIAVKGIGGFHLACRTDSPDITACLRLRKHRDEKPLAIMCRDIKAAERFAEISRDEAAALQSFRKPIVLLKKRDGTDLGHLSENGWIGIMLPYTPLHVLLLSGEIDSMVMTSANLSDLPIIYKNEQALSELAGIADYFLMHDREIETRCDDSLQWVYNGRTYHVRRSRGYVPYPVRLELPEGKHESSGILACGAEQKASFSLTKGNLVFPSQHIGDLKNIETYENYCGQIEHFRKMFDIDVRQIVCDMHPDYMSGEYALELSLKENLPLIKVQHHHAHMASCMADNSLEGKCIGIIWDGTGYGPDGTVWGGEFLTGDYSGFERAGSIRPMRLPGGDKAVHEIWRCAASLLEDAGIEGFAIPGVSGDDLGRVKAMLQADINCPVSTGMGRLFDGVSAILGIREEVSYEGQGAVLLEAAAGESDGVYPVKIVQAPDRCNEICERNDNSEKCRKFGMYAAKYEFDTREMIRCICADVNKGRDAGLIAADFMNTLIETAAEMCRLIREDSGLDKVVLSGGTFQNIYLLSRITARLEKEGFLVYRHSRVSTNDEGISFGQAAIALHRK